MAVEAARVVEHRGIAVGGDPRDDCRDLGADVELLRPLLADQTGEGRLEAVCPVVEALRQG
jgi:hypothetical protein